MSKIYLSEYAHPLLQTHLGELGYEIEIITQTKYTYDPVSAHPDMYLCSLDQKGSVFFGVPQNMTPTYPGNIIYNAACTGKYFIHNLNYTAPKLRSLAKDMEMIHVSQGYTKCNTVIVNETSIITSDLGIAKACQDKMDVLIIENGHVGLTGFPYGFLGGASGRVDNTIFFNGDLSSHPDYKKITTFIEDRDLIVSFFREYPLADIGSIIWHKTPKVCPESVPERLPDSVR